MKKREIYNENQFLMDRAIRKCSRHYNHLSHQVKCAWVTESDL